MHELKELVNARADFVRRHRIELREVTEVVLSREPVVETALAAEDEADLATDLLRIPHDIQAEDARGPRGRDQQSGQDLDRRRLAGAVGSEDAEQLALGYLERETIESEDLFGMATERPGRRPEDTPHVMEFDRAHGGTEHIVRAARSGSSPLGLRHRHKWVTSSPSSATTSGQEAFR